MQMLRYSCWSIFILIFCLSAQSQDIYWIGGTGNWHNTSNWSLSSGGASCSCLPDENSFVHIQETSPTSIVTLSNGDTAKINQIQIEANSQLYIGTSSIPTRAHLEITSPVDRGFDLYGEGFIYGSIGIYDAPVLSALVREGGFLRIREGSKIHVNTRNVLETKGITSRGILILDRKPLNNPGIIELNNINGVGLDCRGTGSTQNNGRIEINNVADDFGMRTATVLVNDSTGVIDIFQCSYGGLRVENTFINKGLVRLDQVDGVHALSNISLFENHRTIVLQDCQANLNIFNADTFSNEADGAINVSGITVQDGIRNLEVFQNYGEINISGLSTAIALNNLDGTDYSYFYNYACGKIFLTNMRNETYFENAGLLTLNSTTISSNFDIFYNKGILEDRQGSMEPYSSIQNDGIISHPLHGAHSLGIPSQGILMGPALNISSAPFFYFNSLQTAPAGTYSLAKDEWLPNGFAGVSEIYTVNSIAGCPTPFVSKILLTNPIEATCPDPMITLPYLFEGVNWFNPYHGDKKQVPSPCFEAVLLHPS